MKTYNFLIAQGMFSQIVEINSNSEDEAIKIIKEEFPAGEG